MLNKYFKNTFLFIVLLEIFSFCAFLLPAFAKVSFLIIIFLIFLLSLQNLEYGLYILLAEIFISSKGYLFSFDFGGFVLSFRIAIWLIIMSIFATKFFLYWFKSKEKNPFKLFFKNRFFAFFIFLFLFIFWGVLNGLLSHHSFNNLFFDFNAWLFFLLLFPFLYVLFLVKDKKIFLRNLLNVFLASSFYLSIKTIFLFYVFTHHIGSIDSFLYKWVRQSGVGEITAMKYDFARIFFQSHIFVLLAFFLLFFVLSYFLHSQKINSFFRKGENIFYISFFVLTIAVNLISLSRSNWLGWLLGVLLSFLAIYHFYNFKFLLKMAIFSFFSFLLAIFLILIVFKFPYPQASKFNPVTLIGERAKQVKNEAGVASRWALLPKLKNKIGQNFILGQGFGALITYKSSDPRVLQNNPDGNYTTYAFEWGWLDIWLKLGFFGFLAYLLLIFQFLKQLYIKYWHNNLNLEKSIKLSLGVFLIVLVIINFFSPYLNHPLGISYLLILSLVF